MQVNKDTTPPGTVRCDPGPCSHEPIRAHLRNRERGTARVRAAHFPGGSNIKRCRQPERLRFASWNVGTMTGNSIEIEKLMSRRRLDILCVQETKWRNTASRARFLNYNTKAYKLFYYGTQQGKNGIGIILKAELTSGIISINKPSDRLMSIKLVINKEIWNIISPYAPQVGCEQAEKDAF